MVVPHFLLKGVNKKTSPITYLVTEGVIIIAQQCDTPCWKRLGACFQVITESFLYDQYLRDLNENVRQRGKDKCELTCFKHVDKTTIPYVLFSSFPIIDPICMGRTPN